MPRKTDSKNPADWLLIAASDMDLVRMAADNEISYSAAHSKLAELPRRRSAIKPPPVLPLVSKAEGRKRKAAVGGQRAEGRGQTNGDRRMAEFDSLVPIRPSVDWFEPRYLVATGIAQALKSFTFAKPLSVASSA